MNTIKIDKKKWETDNFDSYISISEKNEGVVCVYITETGKDLGISDKTIKNKIIWNSIYSPSPWKVFLQNAL